MSTLLSVKVNVTDEDIPYGGSGGVPANYLPLDLAVDSLIWSEDLEDHLTHDPSLT